MPPVPPPTFDVRLIRARPLTPAVRELTFERVDGAPVAFTAGQWLNLELEGGLKRSYSIASPPNGSPRFDVAVTHVQGGPGSSYLHSLEPGAVLKAIGPQGFFTRTHAAPSLFVATGTGITPFRSMLGAIEDASPIWLLLGVRREADILYRDELEALARERSGFRFEVTLSQPPEGWTRRRGYVQAHVRELFEELSRFGTAHAYVCGLKRMIDAVRALLRTEMGLPREQVHSERYD